MTYVNSQFWDDLLDAPPAVMSIEYHNDRVTLLIYEFSRSGECVYDYSLDYKLDEIPPTRLKPKFQLAQS